MATSKGVKYLIDTHGRKTKKTIKAVELSKAISDLKYASNSRAANDALERIDRILEGFGVQYVETDNGRWAAEYVDFGDPYVATVMLQTKPRVSVIVGRGWGDYVEKYDR